MEACSTPHSSPLVGAFLALAGLSVPALEVLEEEADGNICRERKIKRQGTREKEEKAGDREIVKEREIEKEGERGGVGGRGGRWIERERLLLLLQTNLAAAAWSSYS